MRNFIGCCLFIIFTLLLTGCAGVEKEKPLEKEKSPLNTKITIESYNMSEKENCLLARQVLGKLNFSS